MPKCILIYIPDVSKKKKKKRPASRWNKYQLEARALPKLIYITKQINLSYTQSVKQFQYLLTCLALWVIFSYYQLWGFPGGPSSKEPACNAGDTFVP